MLELLAERLGDRTARGLADAVSAAVREGTLHAGDRLPPIRSVATALELSPTTVSAAWTLLGHSGLIRTDGRRGTTITARPGPGHSRYQQAVRRDGGFALDLSTGVPDPELLPDLGAALGRLPARLAPSSYLDAPVLDGLEDLLRADWPFRAEEITIVDGAMDALDLITGALLRFGDRVAVEQPCFPPLLDLLESHGIELLPVRMDDDGPLTEDVRSAIRSGAKAFFCQPRAQNPTGGCLSADRMIEVAAILAGTDVLIVENDSMGAVAASPLVTFAAELPGQVLHIRSFSKSHGPDLRLAALAGPTAELAEISARRSRGQGWSSRILQHLLLELLTDGAAVAQVRRARTEYGRRRKALVAGLGRRGISVAGRDGLNLWVPVANETTALIALAGHGIGVSAGGPFSLDVNAAPHVRVTSGLVATDHAWVADELATAARSRVGIGPR